MYTPEDTLTPPKVQPGPAEPTIGGGTCGCGSGLSARRCCRTVNLSQPTEAHQGRLQQAAERAAEAFNQGDYVGARQICLEILEDAPGQVDALLILATLCRASGQSEAAIMLLQRILRLEPDDLAAAHELAGVLLDCRRLPEAEVCARNAVRLAPDNATSHRLLGMILTENHQPHAGEFHYIRALDIAGPDGITLANLAWNQKLQGRIEEARRLYREATALEPDVYLTWLGWAQTEEAGRDLESASRYLERAKELDPGADTTALEAGLLARKGAHEAALALLEKASHRPGGPTSGELLAKASLLDRLGRHDDAFAAMLAGKARIRQDSQCYAEAEASSLADRLRAFFVSSRLALLPSVQAPRSGVQPIFICGAPRSGTTLVEQILSAHPAVAAGDELPAVAQVMAAAPQMLGSPLGYPEALSELWMGDQRDGLERLRDEYLRRARKLVEIAPHNTHFTDKMPFNEMQLGLIGLMFPSAPIVHVLRHPLDVMLSMMMNDLTHGFECASALETAARHYMRVFDLVAHYRQEMPLRYLALRYEDLVEDLEPNVRRLLGFAGLDFDEGCLRFDENRRLARTASYAQVTEKLYSRSVYRYRSYLRHLAPVVPILEPAIDALGYSI